MNLKAFVALLRLTYSVEVMVGEDLGLGLIVDVGGSHATVAYVRPYGLLDRWNHRCGASVRPVGAPRCEDSRVVRLGDVLVAVNNVARPALELINELQQQPVGLLRLTLAYGQRSWV